MKPGRLRDKTEKSSARIRQNSFHGEALNYESVGEKKLSLGTSDLIDSHEKIT